MSRLQQTDGLTEEQGELLKLVREFVEEQIIPVATDLEHKDEYPTEIVEGMKEMGIFGLMIPEEYGGLGESLLTYALTVEEIARGWMSVSGIINTHFIVAYMILQHGTEEQKQRYLPRMCTGELVGAIAMTEPGTGSDLQGIRTRADKVADGSYIINGSKTFITNGFLAGLMLVVVKTDPTQGAKGLSILIVETENCAGYRVGRVLDKIGMKAQDTSELFFDDVQVGPEQLLGGREGQGFYQLMADLPYERLIIGVTALAAMEGAYEATLDYVRDRKVFGQPVFQLQNTRFKLAEVATEIQVGRAFIDRCVEDLVAEKLDTATASMAKLWGSEAQGRVIDTCLQLFGCYGYMNEYVIGRMYIDARVQRIYGGTSEIMKEVIARAM